MKVQPWCDSPDFIQDVENFYFNNGKEKIDVTHVRIQKNMAIIKIEGIDTPEQAVNYKNKIIFIDRDDFELDEGCYLFRI